MPTLIFDLDGTVLSGNSFHNWLRVLVFGYFGEIKFTDRLDISYKTVHVMVRRKLNKLTHAAAKAALQKIWADALNRDPARLAVEWIISDLYAAVRPNMHAVLIHLAKEPNNAILATAAAGEYAEPLATRLGFKHVIATPAYGSPDWGEENIGEVKRDRAMAYIRAQGWENAPRIFLTDHRDDYALIAECQKILWLGNEESFQQAKTQFPDKHIIHALPLNAREVLAELHDAAPPSPAPAVPPPPVPPAETVPAAEA